MGTLAGSVIMVGVIVYVGYVAVVAAAGYRRDRIQRKMVERVKRERGK